MYKVELRVHVRTPGDSLKLGKIDLARGILRFFILVIPFILIVVPWMCDLVT